MTAPFLPYGRQAIDDDDIAAVAAVLRSDALTTGPEVDRFEQALAQVTSAAHAVSCNSGTGALHLAVAGLGIGEGDKVIVPSLTFLASANCARYVGAEVIFADVDPNTGLMGATHLEAALDRAPRGSVKAVIPVHLNGQCCDLSPIAELADRHHIAIVEDACHALGGLMPDGTKVGSCTTSIAACFSFHPVKTVATGEGGAVTTNDSKLDAAMRTLRSHGMVRQPSTPASPEFAFGPDGQANPWYYEMPELGLNYRLSDIHAALGRSQLRKLDTFVARRAALVARYDALLAKLSNRIRPVGRVGGRPAWHLYVVQIDFAALDKDRGNIMRALSERGIGTQVHYLPVHLQPYYQRRYGRLNLPGAEAYYARCLSLPLFPTMNDSDVDRVVNALTEVIGS
ncbi:MAG: UDP-4-amino-4,6-dideoxy-N-acetyl-beta-L-altrosamine transaminase [Rhodospirillaceae bacterium]|nr:MAG: UDP-4-amino-4,6-dideoxy-N-acetyl-beta-L-altrosamine transaminase [Rhodospirillaceae bacterium]